MALQITRRLQKWKPGASEVVSRPLATLLVMSGRLQARKSVYRTKLESKYIEIHVYVHKNESNTLLIVTDQSKP